MSRNSKRPSTAALLAVIALSILNASGPRAEDSAPPLDVKASADTEGNVTLKAPAPETERIDETTSDTADLPPATDNRLKGSVDENGNITLTSPKIPDEPKTEEKPEDTTETPENSETAVKDPDVKDQATDENKDPLKGSVDENGNITLTSPKIPEEPKTEEKPEDTTETPENSETAVKDPDVKDPATNENKDPLKGSVDENGNITLTSPKIPDEPKTEEKPEDTTETPENSETAVKDPDVKDPATDGKDDFTPVSEADSGENNESDDLSKLYGGLFSWCTLREKTQGLQEMMSILKDVRIAGPEFGFVRASTVEMSNPSDLRIIFLLTRPLPVTLSKDWLHKNTLPVQALTPKPGDPLYDPAEKLYPYVFTNTGSAGNRMFEFGENTFEILVKDGETEKSLPFSLTLIQSGTQTKTKSDAEARKKTGALGVGVTVHEDEYLPKGSMTLARQTIPGADKAAAKAASGTFDDCVLNTRLRVCSKDSGRYCLPKLSKDGEPVTVAARFDVCAEKWLSVPGENSRRNIGLRFPAEEDVVDEFIKMGDPSDLWKKALGFIKNPGAFSESYAKGALTEIITMPEWVFVDPTADQTETDVTHSGSSPKAPAVRSPKTSSLNEKGHGSKQTSSVKSVASALLSSASAFLGVVFSVPSAHAATTNESGASARPRSRAELYARECIINTRLPVCDKRDNGIHCVLKKDNSGKLIMQSARFDICGRQWLAQEGGGNEYIVTQRYGVRDGESAKYTGKITKGELSSAEEIFDTLINGKNRSRKGGLMEWFAAPEWVLSQLDSKPPANSGGTEDLSPGCPTVKGSLAAGGASGWQTNGNQILDPSGAVYNVRGISWFGLETKDAAPHGLWQGKMDDYLATIKKLGFNSLRVPFAVQNLTTGGTANASGDPSLTGKKPLDILDALIDAAGKSDLTVLLDAHSVAPGAYQEEGGPWGKEADWTEAWEMLAKRYADKTNVIGADLSNEPKNGCWDKAACAPNDWQALAQKTGDTVLKTAPGWLIFVEGVGKSDGVSGWAGGAMTGAYSNPIKLSVENKVVYTPHEYGPPIFNQPWFGAADFPENMTKIWEERWSKIHTDKTAPVVIGEFGGKLEDAKEKQWFTSFLSFIQTNNIGGYFWSFNPNSGDTGGIVKDDWKSPQCEKLKLMESWMGGLATECGGTGVKTPIGASPGTTTGSTTGSTGGSGSGGCNPVSLRSTDDTTEDTTGNTNGSPSGSTSSSPSGSTSSSPDGCTDS